MSEADTERNRIIAAYYGCRVQHPFLNEVASTAERLLLRTPSAAVVNIVGPTGVGKSLVASKLEAKTIEACAADMVARRYIKPFIHTTAMASGHHNFSWTGLCWAALEDLNDPFVRSRTLDLPEDDITDGLIRVNQRSSLSTCRSRVQAEFRLRETRVWCIDEANHAVSSRRGGVAPAHQLNVFKSIVQSTQTKLLLLGTEEVARHFFSNGQLARRCQVIRFNRYRSDVPEEWQMFCSVAKTLLARMQIASKPDIDKSTTLGRFLYSGSVGCVGILKEWLERALVHCLEQADDPKHAKLTMDNLRKTRLEADVIRGLMYEIREIESARTPDPNDQTYEELVMPPERAAPKSRPPRARTSALKPGTRLPTRDPLGPDEIWGQPA